MTASTEPRTGRGGFLTAMAIFFVLGAIVDLIKAFTSPPPGQTTFGTPGLVVFGAHRTGSDETILGLLLAVILLLYAVGVWRLRRYALTVAWIYAAYVILNVVLFTIRNPAPTTPGAIAFAIVYIVIAVAVTAGTAIALTRRRADLC